VLYLSNSSKYSTKINSSSNKLLKKGISWFKSNKYYNKFKIDTESDLIITCLNNNHDKSISYQLFNLVTYEGPLNDINKII